MTQAKKLCLAALLLLPLLSGCRSAQTTSAILYMEEQKYDKAVAVLHEALEYNPEEADAFYYLGEAHSKLAEVAISDNRYLEAKENYEIAYRNYMRAAELDPQQFAENAQLAIQHNYTLRSNEAKNEYQARYYEAAEGFFRLAYAALPDSIAPIKNIARMKIQQAGENANDPKLLGEALDLLDQVLAVRPDAYELLADKANVLAKLGRSEEANAIYDGLLTDHPNDTALLIDIANLAVQDRRLERAADLYIRLIDLLEKDGKPENDEDIKPLMTQAAGWLADDEIRRYDEAIDLYKRALQLELVPEQQTLFGRLQAHYKFGKSLLNQAETEADPTRKADLQARANAQFTEGVNVGNATVEQFFDCAYCYYYLALCQGELGDAKASEINFQKYFDLQNVGGGGSGQ
jgi:tetratricopeptide (TPR) repeat protein